MHIYLCTCIYKHIYVYNIHSIYVYPAIYLSLSLVCFSGEPPRQTHTHTHTHTKYMYEREILRNWLIWSQALASCNSVEQAGRLEIQGRVGVSVLSPKSAGWKLRQNFYVAFWRQNWCFFRTDVSQSFSLKAFNWFDEATHIMEENLLHLKCIDLNISHI